PSPPTPPQFHSSELFAEAEALELAAGQDAQAADTYAHIAQSGPPAIRAEALVRQARVLRREKQWADALKAYGSLEKMTEAVIAGMPASLVARDGRRSVLADSGDPSAQREAAVLMADLTSGHWTVTRPALETFLRELQPLAPGTLLPPDWT